MVKSRGHHQQVLCHTEWENPVSEYYTEGPNTVIWLMDFENSELTEVGKCELNTWEWENSKVSCARAFLMTTSYSCKAPSTLHPILSCHNFIRWSPSLKYSGSRMFTPHRRRLFPCMQHLRKLSDQRWWKEFWRRGHRWWKHVYIFRFKLVRGSSIQVIYLYAARPQVQALRLVQALPKTWCVCFIATQT